MSVEVPTAQPEISLAPQGTAPGPYDFTVFSAMARVITSYDSHLFKSRVEWPASLPHEDNFDTVVQDTLYQQRRAAVRGFSSIKCEEEPYSSEDAQLMRGECLGGERPTEARLTQAALRQARQQYAAPRPITLDQKNVLRHAIAWRADSVRSGTDEAEIAELDFLCGLFGFDTEQRSLPAAAVAQEQYGNPEAVSMFARAVRARSSGWRSAMSVLVGKVTAAIPH